jgi:hypothetical protein
MADEALVGLDFHIAGGKAGFAPYGSALIGQRNIQRGGAYAGDFHVDSPEMNSGADYEDSFPSAPLLIF